MHTSLSNKIGIDLSCFSETELGSGSMHIHP